MYGQNKSINLGNFLAIKNVFIKTFEIYLPWLGYVEIEALILILTVLLYSLAHLRGEGFGDKLPNKTWGSIEII